jgi:hypothetical protein
MPNSAHRHNVCQPEDDQARRKGRKSSEQHHYGMPRRQQHVALPQHQQSQDIPQQTKQQNPKQQNPKQQVSPNRSLLASSPNIQAL